MANEITPQRLIVQKYGGATLATPEKIKQVARRIHLLHKTGTQVVVVVSAMGQTTNQLIELARNVSPNPHLRELDMLLTVGERISMSLLSMALNDLGSQAISFTGSQAGILTNDSHVNASIIDVKAFRVEQALKENKIVILAGFQGVSPVTKEITTLGRGGSDTSAVAMAAFLKADRCEILKDVDAVYSADPKIVNTAKSIQELHYDHLLEMTKWGAKVLHHKSVEMAQLKNVRLYVGSAEDEKSNGTLISDSPKMGSNRILAVNSYGTVIHFSNQNKETPPLTDFYALLTKNQIGAPEILYCTNEQFYISGPKENLDLIENFNFSHSKFTLIEKTLCSISVTCASSPTEDIIQLIQDKLDAENIIPIQKILSNKNVNYIFQQKDKAAVVQLLHTLI
ncbi:MAG: hypothetical protein A2622_03430 [Bdellovibrionales bacterium RIFCSPHIGHO2_01_FULL_40_29]|nr:MAG: hypothetical protein A2622_03430 [Bdellovibrionales bacterium RIFCSPHIGHO2_01_FULL_40_29]OFZ34119.1 MAG: hypothetical protein A3D17_03850 [Bdellovibrionales bacterium RIFCSPHIGHO2_02_FULL_40_15]